MILMALALASSPLPVSPTPVATMDSLTPTQAGKPLVQRPEDPDLSLDPDKTVRIANGLNRLNGGGPAFFDPNYWTWWISLRGSTRPTCTKSAACG